MGRGRRGRGAPCRRQPTTSAQRLHVTRYPDTAAANAVDPDLPRVLRGLLETDPDERASRLESLRAGPTKVAGAELGEALHRVAA